MSNIFECIFPRLPKDFGIRDIDSEYQYYGWRTYLSSFRDRLEGPQNVVQQPNSLVTSFCHRKRDESELIDTIELLQHRSLKGGKTSFKEFASWQELRLAPSGSGDTDVVGTT